MPFGERTSLGCCPKLVNAPDKLSFSWQPMSPAHAQPRVARRSHCRDASSDVGPARGSSVRTWRTRAPVLWVAPWSACRDRPRSATREASGSVRAIDDTFLEPRRTVDTLWHRRRQVARLERTMGIRVAWIVHIYLYAAHALWDTDTTGKAESAS